MKTNKVYLAGPMTGKPDNNFPLFNRVSADLREQGYDVVNPAELDAGEVLTHPWDYYLRRDLKKLVDCDTIALLPGWNTSRGALLERHVAESLGMNLALVTHYVSTDRYCIIGFAPSAKHAPLDSILTEAESLVAGDRGTAYGHPGDDFARTGKIWGAILGIPDVKPELVGLCMVGVKISREVNKPKRDNRLDGAGYFKCVDMIHEREGK